MFLPPLVTRPEGLWMLDVQQDTEAKSYTVQTKWICLAKEDNLRLGTYWISSYYLYQISMDIVN